MKNYGFIHSAGFETNDAKGDLVAWSRKRHTFNLALGRIFSMGEYGHFEFRWETFGTLNHPSFSYPSSTIGTAATAGVINSTNGGNRIMQFSGRYEF